MAKRDPNDKRNFVILGGGAAGLSCAETLRQSGYTGKITLLNPEKVLPYDRTILTKGLPVATSSKLSLRDEAWLKEADIDLVNKKVYSIHPDVKKIALDRGEPMDYDKLLISTGGAPFVPPVKGLRELGVKNNMHVLRSAKD
jgi:NAD(P)H-nitrite reductase large subunit